mmetsp:Transcript_49723/g.101085  ORF Transcript_49723/g.101085 Transcript_49723/m.101085 type:complete len:672 (+) Transcript_49723:68-2083(+)
MSSPSPVRRFLHWGSRKESVAIGDSDFPKTAKPQIVPAGEGRSTALEVWPEKWGITVKQFARLLDECREDPDWTDEFTVADLVQKYVIPMTRGTGLSYAVLVNANSPKEVDVMISHAWAENALDFCRTLERSVQYEESLFICALSLYQCEDNCGPTIAEQLGTYPQESPFHRVLQRIHDRGKEIEKSGGWWRQSVVLIRIPWILLIISVTCVFTPVVIKGCIPMHTTCAYGTCKPLFEFLPIYVWEWTFKPLEGHMYAFVCIGHIVGVVTVLAFVVLQLLQRTGHLFKGRMVAVPNHNCEMYTRLWCVFEMFVAQTLLVPVKLANTLASAGEVNSANAQCSKVEDAKKIDEQIRQYHFADEESDEDAGYEMLDEAIREVNNKAWSRAFFILVLQAGPLAFCLMCTVRLIKKGSMHWWEEQASHRGGVDWYHHVLYLASHGRLGYDLFCHEVFEASPKAMWSWLLILGTLIGYWVVLSCMVYVAKKAQGHLSFCRIASVALGLIFIEVVLNISIVLAEHFVGVCKYHPYRFNWFVLGFTAAISQGSLILLLLVLVNGLRYVVLGPPALLGKGAETGVKVCLGLAGLIAFFFIMFFTCRAHHPEHWFPTIVVNGALIYGWLLGPLGILLANGVRFGVRFNPSTSLGGCRHSRQIEYDEVSHSSSSGYSDEDVK